MVDYVVSIVGTPAFWVGTVFTMLLERLVLQPLLWRPLGDWWAQQRQGKERLLKLDSHIRFMENGGRPVRRSWRDHCRAWWWKITWRWSPLGKEARETWRNLPPPAGPRGCYF